MTAAPRKPAGVSHHDWMEGIIKRAESEGAFDRIAKAPDPMAGVDLDRADDENWWLRKLLEREGLTVPHAATNARMRIMALIQRLPSIPTEAAVRAEAVAINAEIAELALTDASPLMRTLAPLAVEALVARWRDGRARHRAALARP